MSATTESEAFETPRNTQEPQQPRGRTAAEELAALPGEVRENPHGRSAANPPCRRYGPYFGTEGGEYTLPIRFARETRAVRFVALTRG